MSWRPVHQIGLRDNQIFPELEAEQDVGRGEQRLAAEVVLSRLRGRTVPRPTLRRAADILVRLAKHQ